MTSETNIYAHQKNVQNVQFSTADIRRFLGILLYSGWASTPAYRSYWSLNPLFGRSIIKNTMSRNQFDEIKRFFHVSNNSCLDTSDKFAKIRPLIDKINSKFMKFGLFSHHLSIDEQIVPYFGHHSCRMFIKNKPVRFGFKLWCLCSSDGYLYKFIPYAGAQNKNDKGVAEKKLGLGGYVVMSLLQDVTPNHHEIFFDNFFTSRSLIGYLTGIGQVATGTIRDNRTGKIPSNQIVDVKKFKKYERGKFETSNDRISLMRIVRWNDNSVVTLASNKYDSQPIQQVKRYCRKSKRFINIDCPNVVSVYNKHMGGVDLHDNAVARINIRSKKWYWPLIATMIDSCVVNAWKLQCAMQKYRKQTQSAQIDFRSCITEQLLLAQMENISLDEPRRQSTDASSEELEQLEQLQERKTTRAFSQSFHVAEETRYSKVGHIPEKNTNNRRIRCRLCRSQTLFFCKKCNVALHTNCFAAFHKK